MSIFTNEADRLENRKLVDDFNIKATKRLLNDFIERIDARPRDEKYIISVCLPGHILIDKPNALFKIACLECQQGGTAPEEPAYYGIT